MVEWLQKLPGTTDLAQYAEMFLNHNISGRRLLLLREYDLRKMGITSQGHLVHMLVRQNNCIVDYIMLIVRKRLNC